MNRDDIENWIQKAWHEVRRDFYEKRRSILWREDASIKYPLYRHLLGLQEKYETTSFLVVPEFRPTRPKNTMMCGCPNESLGLGDERWHIDMCIVQLEEDTKDRTNWCWLWCYKPKPLVAFEVKYTRKVTGAILRYDVMKLQTMIDKWDCDLAYLCLVVTEKPSRISLPIKKYHKRFRVAIGYYGSPKKKWKIVPFIEM